MRKSPALAGLASLLLAAAGITIGGAARPAAAIPRGGTAVVALSPDTSPNWFFPLVSFSADSTTNSTFNSMAYLPLLYYNSHAQLSDYYGLANSVTSNKAGNIYTVKMNPKWHWSNGTPVTAQDVVFTYDLMHAASLYHTNYAWTYAGQGSGGLPNGWKSVTATGKYTVVITTKKPVNALWFETNGIDQIIPVPKSIWDKYPTNMVKELSWIKSISNSPGNPAYQVVDGPWKFQSAVANLNWTYVPNPHYDGGHPAYMSKLVFQYETSDTAEFEALKEGTINYGFMPSSDLTESKLLPNDILVPQYSLSFNYLQLNMNSKAPNGIGKAFQQLPVRQALQMGVNEPGIIKTLWGGYGSLDDTIVADKPSNIWLDPALAKKMPYPYNPAKGKALLEKNGWHEVNGVMKKNGIKLEFTMICASGSSSYTSIDQLLAATWAKEGIKVTLSFAPFNTVIAYGENNAGKWAVLNWNGGWGYAAPYPSGDGLLNTGGAENSGSYSSPTMNALIADTTTKPATTAEAIKAMYAYEEYAAKQLPSDIFLPDQASLTVIAKNLHNAVNTYNPIGGWFFPGQWYE